MFERVREAVRWVVLLARFVVSIVPLLLRSVAGTIARAFDPYTGQARRAIQFARLEACRFSTKTIETEHLLLGLLHQHQHLSDRIHRLNAHASRTESRNSAIAALSEIRKEIELRKLTGPKTPPSVDLGLSEECKRAMAFAAEEAREMRHQHIGNEHLLVGLLREEKCLAAELLRARGIDLEEARKDLKQGGSA
jgi:ATP-dependent Clp protease ATP-binding subunit ClpC